MGALLRAAATGCKEAAHRLALPYDILMRTRPVLSRFLMRLLPDPHAHGPLAEGERHMMDLVMVALGVGGFALLGAYAALCARL
jgi:hypothetical protein